MNTTKTKHKADCQRIFKNYDKNCPRCQELMAGAKPRMGWNDARRVYPFAPAGYTKEEYNCKLIKEHDCKKAGCGPVCTFGEW